MDDDPGIELRAELREEVEKVTASLAAAREALIPPIPAKELPETIYHYTDDQGLKGILQSGELWFTSIFNQNDPSELRHGLSIGQKLLEDILDLKSADPFLQELFSERGFESQVGSFGFYTCSFSSDKDELGQWRSYADDGRGFAIGFDATSLTKEKKFMIYPVRYDDELLRRIFGKLTKIANPLFRKYANSKLESQEFYAAISIYSALLSQFAIVSTLHKHEDYKQENEVRLIGMPNPSGIRFRTRPYELVKYTHYNYKETQFIKEIVVGPSTKDQSTTFVRDCVRAFYDRSVIIVSSEIPYRPSR